LPTRTIRRILWIASALLVPLPVLFPGPGLVPAARFLMLGGVSLAVMLFESARGAVAPLAALLLLQGIAWLGVLWLVAALAARLLGRLPAHARLPVTLTIVVAGLVVGATVEIYHTPFAAEVAHGNLLHVYR
jgi:hypothetical protein